jgi:hypothetical protein
MVRAASCPFNDTSREAVIWLDDFFDICDKDPEGDLVHCNVSTKMEVWEMYSQEKQLLGSPYLSYKDFIDLWNGLFPHCVCRPWVDIPGKCHICCEIDRMRRSSSDRMVQLRLKEAHHMHRGGLFMLEREE